MTPTDQEVAGALRGEKLQVRPCGLNADWSVRAWHLGPSSTPNMNAGDLYLVDDETGDSETFFVVRVLTTEDDPQGTTVEDLNPDPLNLGDAVRLARAELSSGSMKKVFSADDVEDL